MVEKEVMKNPALRGVMVDARKPIAFHEIELIDLCPKPGYLRLFTKTDPDQIPDVMPLIMTIMTFF